MPNYSRTYMPGARYFFTVNLEDRHGALRLTDQALGLRSAFAYARARRPFDVEAIVVLPDHLHTIWRLPEGDADFSVRWSLLKGCFSRALEAGEPLSASRARKRERGIWQRRFREHVVRDETDLERHLDYIHYNPVKHAASPAEWRYSSFRRFVEKGWYAPDWAAGESVKAMDMG
jgi:putative transposase